jgi:hypothetical protein
MPANSNRRSIESFEPFPGNSDRNADAASMTGSHPSSNQQLKVSEDLTGFKNALNSTCTNCGYCGTMGWNKRKVPSAAKWLVGLTIVVGLLTQLAVIGGIGGVVTGLVVGGSIRLFQGYCAQCPNCKSWRVVGTRVANDVRKLPVAADATQ